MSMKNYFKAVVLFAGMILAPVLALAQSPCTITQLPYRVEMNESYPDLPECWTTTITQDYTNYGFIQVGNNNFLWTHTNLIAPPIDSSISVSSLLVKWRMSRTPNDNSVNLIEISVGTDTSDQTTFTPIDTMLCATQELDRIYEVSLQNYSGNGRFIQFRVFPDDSDHIFSSRLIIAEVAIESSSACSSPLTVSADVSDTSATFTWLPRAGETLWQYALCPENGIPTVWTTTNTPTASISGLSSNTSYDFYLKAACGLNTGYASIPVWTFTTTCPSFLGIPYHEDFSNINNGECWTNAIFWDGTCGIQYDYVALPGVSPSTDISNLMMKFEFLSDFPLEIGVMTSPADIASFVPLDTVVTQGHSQWTYTEVLLRNYSDTGRYIAFRGSGAIRELYVDTIPSCIYPFPVTTSAITGNTADLVLTNRGNENSWEIAYGLVGFDPDNDGTHFVESHTTPALTGLSINTAYDVYVRSLCGETHSDWSRVYSFVTICGDITQIPYSEDFDTYGIGVDSFPSCWQRHSMLANYSYDYIPHIVSSFSSYDGEIQPTSNPGMLYFNGYDSYDGSQSAWMVLPRLADNINLQELQLTVNLLHGSIRVGVMDNPLDYQTFTTLDTISLAENYYQPATVSTPFFHYQGSGRYVAFAHDYGECLIDDVVLEVAPPCGVPQHLTVTNILGTSAIVSWSPVEYGTEQEYILLYAPTDGTLIWDSLAVTGHQAVLEHLMPNTEYVLRLRCSCVEGNGAWDTVRFTTLCASSSHLQINNGSSETIDLPFSLNKGRSYCQQIFTEEELRTNGVSGLITALEFQYTGPEYYYSNSRSGYVELYLANTGQRAFDTDTSWISFDSLQLVFADTVSYNHADNPTWKAFNLQTPFYYSGSGNIVVVGYTNTEVSCGNTFLAEHLTENRSIYYSEWNDPPESPSPAIYPQWQTYSGNNTSGFRSNIRFVLCEDSVNHCPTPNLLVTSINGNNADIEIIPGAMEEFWELQHKTLDDSVWIEDGVQTATSRHLQNLPTGKEIVARVRAACSPADSSLWQSVVFFTGCGNISSLPFFEYFDSYGSGSSTDGYFPTCWIQGGNTSGSPYIVDFSYSAPGALFFTSTPSTYSLAALPPLEDTIDVGQLQLYFYGKIRGALQIGVMEDPTDPSTFVLDTVLIDHDNVWKNYEIPLSVLSGLGGTHKYITFFHPQNTGYSADFYIYSSIDNLEVDWIPTCPHPVHPTSLSRTGNSIELTWTDPGNALQWTIEYGPQVFTHGTGTVVMASSNPFTVTGLSSNTTYDFYVRSDCGNEGLSRWSHDCCTASTMECDSSSICALKFILWDGDTSTLGWGNIMLNVFANGILQQSLQLVGLGPDTVIVPVCDSSHIACSFAWDGAPVSWVNEMITSVISSNGEVLWNNFDFDNYTWSDGDSAFVFDHVCSDNFCLAPTHLFADSISAHSVRLNWTELNDENSWYIDYRLLSDSLWTSVIVNSNPASVGNLIAQTEYVFRVRAICSDNEESDIRDSIIVRTTCDGVTHSTITGNTTFNYDSPDFMYKYQYCQQIYWANEFYGDYDITSFDLYSLGEYTDYSWDIYMGHTTLQSFPYTGQTNVQYGYIVPETLSLVYSGTITDYESGEHWMTIQLDSAFHYNGIDNLVIAVYGHNGVLRSGNKFKVYNCQDYRQVSFYDYQMAPFDPTNSNSLDMSNMRSVGLPFVNVIRFPKCCATPYGVFVQPNATDTTATVTWQPGGGESQWVLEYKLNSATEWTSVVCNQPSYLIADVVPSVQYMGRVMAVCDTASGEGSGFVDFTFTVVPAAPAAYSIVSSAGPGGTILPTGNINVMSGYDMTFDIVADTAAGYVIQDVLVDEVSQGPVPTYTFYAVDADHTIRAEFQNVGIEDFPEESLVLYPNPTNGKLRIENGELTIDGVEVYDVYGKLLQTVTVNDVAADLDVTHLPAGLYFARIRTDNGVVTKRFVKR